MAKKELTKEQKEKHEKVKADNFVRLAEMRVVKALKVIDALGNLANKNTYSYTEAQTKNIVETLGNSVESVRLMFAGKKYLTSAFKL